jgi:zinc and cadmium transporter
MEGVWIYGLVSVFAVSLISLVGVTVYLSERWLRKLLIYLVSFAAGGLFGSAFLHLLPEAFERFGLSSTLYTLGGIIAMFMLETFLRWRHCHILTSAEHVHPLAWTNLFGDALHNFLDGLVIAASYLVAIPLGMATALAVAFHEIPQEIGDFGILLYAGFSRRKAILFNFLTALAAVGGAVFGLTVGIGVGPFIAFLIPFAAGNFIYIAGSDLVPELHRGELPLSRSLLELTTFLAGIGIMGSLRFLEI